jgi:HTH-type transcriptional regulator/antitoxin HigA
VESDDQLWFTLFHELGHVLLHGDKDLYLNGEQTAAAAEANTYASDVLIPPAFEDRLPRTRDIAAVRQLADGLGIAPSIVLGRVQRETTDYG